MNNLKYFAESFSDNLYHQIDSIDSSTLIDFTPRIINRIRNLQNTLNPRNLFHPSFCEFKTSYHSKQIEIAPGAYNPKYYYRMYVLEICNDDDDYYYCEIYSFDDIFTDLPSGYNTFNGITHYYYKCDGLEGLKQLMEDIGRK